MPSPIAQVSQPEELSELNHDNDNDKAAAKKYAEARKRQRRHQNERSGLTAAGFAYSRRRGILDLMHMRFGGPCLTDDAELFAELLVPFIVQAALLHRLPDGSPRNPYGEAAACLGHALPLWMKARGEAELPGMVASAITARDTAIEASDPAAGQHAKWLPTMPELVAALRPTREEARHLRGWGCIDPATPEERLEADRLRKRAERAAKGATPREESVSARKPWVALGISRAKWYRIRREGQTEAAETVSSRPSKEEYGPDEFVSPPKLYVPDLPDNWRDEFVFIGEVVGVLPEDLAQLQIEFPGLDIVALLPDLDAEIVAQGWEAPEAGGVLWDLLRVRHAEMHRAA